MTVGSFDVSATIERVKEQLEKEQDMSESMRSLVEMLLMIVTLLVNKPGLNSRNSSKPPSTDPNRKKAGKATSMKKRGAQPWLKGITLQRVDDPDQIEVLKISTGTRCRKAYISRWAMNRVRFSIFKLRERSRSIVRKFFKMKPGGASLPPFRKR